MQPQPSSPHRTPDGSLSAGWRDDSALPVLDVHRADPTQAFRIRVAGMEHGLVVGSVHGTLAVHANPDGSREIRCPACDDGTRLVNQEWVYSSRRVAGPALARIDDPTVGTLWFLTVAGESDEGGAHDIAGALAAPFLCLSCERGYTLPADVHIDIELGAPGSRAALIPGWL
jgi:hypothetical protein